MSQHPIMAFMGMLEHNSFLGPAETIEEDIMPLDNQLNLTYGDTAIVVMASTPLEDDFSVLRLVDPAKHSETFPDWEERLLKSFVLAEFFSARDIENRLGWFSRLKLIPISKYRYYQAREWQKSGFPDELPDWVGDLHMDYTDALSVRAPDRIPRADTCSRCGGREVEIQVIRTLTYTTRCGEVQNEGKILHIPIKDVDTNDQHVAHLHCRKCGKTTHLEDGDWALHSHPD